MGCSNLCLKSVNKLIYHHYKAVFTFFNKVGTQIMKALRLNMELGGINIIIRNRREHLIQHRRKMLKALDLVLKTFFAREFEDYTLKNY